MGQRKGLIGVQGRHYFRNDKILKGAQGLIILLSERVFRKNFFAHQFIHFRFDTILAP